MIETQEIVDRLSSFGYTCNINDVSLVSYLQKKVESHVKHFCNIKTIPDCLKYVVIDGICGEFLGQKKATGQLTETQMQSINNSVSGAIKSIQEGDTKVEYATSNNVMDGSILFDNLIQSLEISNDILISHRCLRW